MSNNNRNRSRRPRTRSRRPEAYEPVRISTKPAEGEESKPEPKRIPLFYIDGVEYSVPEALPPAIGLRYLRDVRDGGNVDFAVAQLLTEAMGEDAFDALADCDQVGHAEMVRITDRVMEIALGATETGKS